MATYKRIDGDYNITTLNTTDNVNIKTHTVVVDGNLKVAGNLTYIDVTELNVTDPFIVLNASNTPANTSSYFSNSGILTHKTSSDYAGLRYNKSINAWEISLSTSDSGITGTWEKLATTNTAVLAAGSNTQVQFNDSSVFGASAKFTFDKVSGTMTLQGPEVLGNIGTPPLPTANAVTIYHNAPAGGGTGIYFKDTTTQDELISRSKAIVFSLIF